ncbi:MAG TPA: SDR family oxidoreductase [Amnibacterium sp.]|nr:SDR family oxidoreductase [Amnibacterium sp.]
MDLGIEGKTALVFGGDSGIGWHTARRLLAEGVTVVVSDIDQARLDASAARLGAPDGRLFAFAADVTRQDELTALRERIEQAVGQVDIVVQASGITGPQGDFDGIDDEAWTHTLEVDLMGPVRIARTFLPHLRRGWGRLVFVASEDGVQPYSDEIPYCAAKAGVLALMKGLSRPYAEEGLTVNAVSPAFIATPMTDAMMTKASAEQGIPFDEAVEQMVTEKRPFMAIKRRGDPDEVAAVIAFLVSAPASFVNGANYRVDAGSVGSI